MDHWQTFFWDGRASSAEQQALMPISNPIEMDFTPAGALQRVNQDASYRDYIQRAFGEQPDSSSKQQPALTESQMAKAIVAFERTITLPETKYSRFL